MLTPVMNEEEHPLPLRATHVSEFVQPKTNYDISVDIG
jgi:hypothetical protein